MQADTFIKLVKEQFPIQHPDASRLFEGIRSESGCEKLEFLVHVKWPDLTLDMLEEVAGEFWQMSSVWNRYFLPGFMCLTAKHDIEIETHTLKTGAFIEVAQTQEALMTCISSYFHSMMWFMTVRWDIATNLFYGLTSSQMDLIETWLYNIDFDTLNEAGELFGGFDYSKEAIEIFVKKARTYSV
ncbi:hypothetical protein [Hellea balneolensis]|uniref:hypothetical protein n=1 Tax=Hellea balneolensis TaxID=287478 RepID=UPI00040ECB3A|nr:hypothetical protein [Hellea balneolensis]